MASWLSATISRAIARRQDDVVRRNEVLAALANHRDLDAFRQILGELLELLNAATVAERNLAHVKSLGLGRELRLYMARHEVDAQDRTDHAERIGNRISDRRLAVAHDVEGSLQRGRARHRTGEDAKRVTNLDAEGLAKRESDKKARNDSNERQRIALDARRTGHALKELPAVKNANPVEEHDQTA